VLEAVFEARELLVPVELGVDDQAGVVVEEGIEEGLALSIGVSRVGQSGAVHGVRLPQVAEVVALEAAEDPVGRDQAAGGSTAGGQVAAQGAGGNRGFGGRAGRVALKDGGDGAGGAGGEFALEGFGAVEGVGGEDPRGAPVAAGSGLEGVKAAGAVGALPAAQGGAADGVALGVGDGMMLARDGGAQVALGAVARAVVAEEGQDEGIAEQGDLGPPGVVRGWSDDDGLGWGGFGHGRPPGWDSEASIPEAAG
jgi:hypothetical protein